MFSSIIHNQALKACQDFQAQMKRQGMSSDFNDAEKEILLALYRANNSPEAFFKCMQMTTGVIFWINETPFHSTNNKATMNAIAELCLNGYLRNTGIRNDVFVLTEKGFICAEHLN